MKNNWGHCIGRIARIFLVALLPFFVASAPAATPPGGSITSTSPTITWTGGPFQVSNPAGCRTTSGLACDNFALTIVPPPQPFVVTVRVAAARMGDDIDLFVRDPNGNTIARSTTSGGVEQVVLNNPPAGTYMVVVQPFLVVPGATYSGFAAIGSPPPNAVSTCYNGALYTANFQGVPGSTPAPCSLVSDLQVSFNLVGRRAAEPTIGVNRNNTAFFAASTFDFPTSTAPVRLARTLVMRSQDKGQTWQAVSPDLAANLPEDEQVLPLTFPPTSLDPYVYLDPVGLKPSATTGRIFSVDLDLVCGANAIFSDDEGAHWTSVPLFGCTVPLNDHQTLVTAPPPPGLSTIAYPSMLYVCYNRVSDSICSRSNNGGLFFTTTSPAFTGVDPAAGGSLCGGLTGHLAADSAGRIFLPKGHCGLPWVAASADGGASWTRVKITPNTPMADHEVTLAVDTADNIYAVWQDGTFRLAFLSVSRDHGMTWSTPIMFTPPGVHEVNFPTIIAGDPGRIAVLFPGSQSQNFSDPTRPWNIYIVVSVNALDANPTFIWTTANDPTDPVHRGNCGPGRCDAQDGGSMFDFLHIQLSPADGAFWGTASKTCVTDPNPANNCVTNPQAQKLRPGQGVAIRQIEGPALLVNPPCHVGDGDGDVPGGKGGTAHFHFHDGDCDDQPETETFSDANSGVNFQASGVTSVTYDNVAHNVTIVGTGTNNGLPVAFTIVAVNSALVPPGMFSITLSNGYTNTGNLLAGTIRLR